jgi:hypothetical protein
MFVPYKEVELLSPEDAVRQLLRSGRCYMEYDMAEPQRAVIDRISIDYMSSGDFEYKLPVWKLQGTFYGVDFDGERAESNGSISIYAVK